MNSYLLSFLILSPLAGIFALLFVKAEDFKGARFVAMLSTAVSFVLSLFMLDGYDRQNSFAAGFSGNNPSQGFQFVESLSWVPAFGINYILGIDGMSLWLIVLTTLLTFLVVVASASITKKVRSYLACILFLEIGMLGAFCALDALTFYVFWELMLVPMYFLIGVWGGARKIYAAIKFFLYTAFGSLLMLVAICFLAYAHKEQFGAYSFYLGDWAKLTLSYSQEMWLFAAFAFAFAIKIPLFPFHTWLPDAHVEAPTGGSVILAGVLLKMGLYGLIRIGMPIFPNAVVEFAPAFLILGVIGIVFGALVAWVQTDIKKLVAYSSVSHLGFCVIGFAALNTQGVQGSILQMINHGISTAALFLLVGVLYDRKHTREIVAYGGLAQKVPVFAVVFLIFTLSSIGLPVTNGFVGEYLILLGTFGSSPYIAAIAATGVVLGAIYMLSLYRRTMFGELDEEKNGDLEDLVLREKLVFAPLLILVFVIGVYPKIIMRDIEPSTEVSLSYVKSSLETPKIQVAQR